MKSGLYLRKIYFIIIMYNCYVINQKEHIEYQTIPIHKNIGKIQLATLGAKSSQGLLDVHYVNNMTPKPHLIAYSTSSSCALLDLEETALYSLDLYMNLWIQLI